MVSALTHIMQIRHDFDVTNSLQYHAGLAPMLFQWSHSHMQHFLSRIPDKNCTIKRGLEWKNRAIQKSRCVCQGTKSQQSICYEAVYLSLSAGDFTSSSSHMCGSWFLSIFLFRDGSLTMISIAALMDITMLWCSLPKILKLSMDVSWPLVL